ncbi:MAG: hypothetical protein N2V77_06150 [Canidatus Methanoxibalbensis ujae]|nr:hypothetical protein [Candidatus Methanoxibalbensis ujae]MCW7078643.1 hypothetical protein [Candidatus Methanoxibalbensis ujae]
MLCVEAECCGGREVGAIYIAWCEMNVEENRGDDEGCSWMHCQRLRLKKS